MTNRMSKVEEVKLHIKVVINRQKNKVLFAEAGSDFTDVLLSFLLLPLGTILKVLQKHKGDEAPVIGSLNTLYKGIAKFDSIHFQTEAAKQKLLAPSSCYETESRKLRLNINYPQPTSSNSVKKYDGVFTESAASFLISDDLQVMPNVVGSFKETLYSLGIAVADMDGAETRNEEFEFKEILALLWLSLTSKNPLSALILSRNQMSLASDEQGNAALLQCINQQVTSMNPKMMILKVMIQKSTNKLLFAQADYDFINFLFGMLMLPLGRVEWFLGSNTGLKTIDNLHRSIVDDSNKVQLKSSETKALLTTSNCHVTPNEFSRLNFDSDIAKNHHVKGVRMYMVSDDLTVSPLAMTSCLSVFNGAKISVSDVEEVEVQVGLEEGLSILRAALTSTTALTDGLIKPLLKKRLQEMEQEMRVDEVSLSSNSALSDGLVNQTSMKRPKLEC